MKRKHLTDEEQTAPNAHDDIGGEAYQKQAADRNVIPGQEDRQEHENRDGRMNGDPEPLKGQVRRTVRWPTQNESAILLDGLIWPPIG